MRGLSWRRPYAILTVAFAILLVGLLVFLGLSSKPGKGLTLSSGQPGGVYLPLARSISKVVGEGEDGIGIEVLESQGSASNACRLRSGEVDLALIQNDTSAGDGIRTLVPLHEDVLHFVVREDSGIRHLGQVEGRTIAVGLPDSGSHRLVTELIRHFEVNLAKTDLRPMLIQKARDELASGKIDGLLMVLSMKSGVVEELVADEEVRLVGIGTETGAGSEIEGFRLSYPYVEPYLIPIHAYAMPHGDHPGIPATPLPTVAVRTVLAAGSGLPDASARRITRRIVESRNRLTVGDHQVSLMGPAADAGPLQFPLHDGAAQYFNRNEPGFLVRYAEVIGLVISLLIASYGMFRAGRKWLTQRQKDRIDAYYLELNHLLDRMLRPQTRPELMDIQRRLQAIRSKALNQLAKERLLPDESFRIFQTVLAEASAQVRHQLGELRAD